MQCDIKLFFFLIMLKIHFRATRCTSIRFVYASIKFSNCWIATRAVMLKRLKGLHLQMEDKNAQTKFGCFINVHFH